MRRVGAPYAPPWTTQYTCPYRTQDESPGSKRPIAKMGPSAKRARPYVKSEDACRKWNKYHYMSCPHGDSCAYTHECSICRSTDHEDRTAPGGGLCSFQKAHPRPGYMDAVLCYILSCSANKVSRKGPVTADVLSCNRTPEQEIPLASLYVTG